MKIVHIDAGGITSWDALHDVFAEALRFPSYYGRNMNAWIDCMSDLDPVALQLNNIESINPELFSAIIECAAFVNWRNTNSGAQPTIAISYHRSPS